MERGADAGGCERLWVSGAEESEGKKRGHWGGSARWKRGQREGGGAGQDGTGGGELGRLSGEGEWTEGGGLNGLSGGRR